MTVSGKIYQNTGNPDVIRWVEPEDLSILDLGCGAGDNARLLKRERRHIDGITLSSDEAKLAGQVMRQVVVHNLECGLPTELHGPYDAVIASHVLEHICYPDALLKDILAALSARGRLIVALPNVMMLKYRWRLLWGKFEYESGGTMDDTHFRWYTFVSARKLLTIAGFEILHASATGHLPLGPLRKILPRNLLSVLDKTVCRVWPGLFGVQLIYVASPSKT